MIFLGRLAHQPGVNDEQVSAGIVLEQLDRAPRHVGQTGLLTVFFDLVGKREFVLAEHAKKLCVFPGRNCFQLGACLHDVEAISANRTLLRLDPPDPAETHYRLARLLHKRQDPEAKRQTLQALEEAPRFRDALKLLRELQSKEPQREAGEPPKPN